MWFASGLTLSIAVACTPTITTTTTGSPIANTSATAPTTTPPQTLVLRIGHQKFDPLTLVKNKGKLEARLKPLGVTEVKWTEFPSGPPQMEALAAGSIDIARTGDAPPVSAQAAGSNFVYVGTSAPKDSSSALLVKEDSPIKTIADLKGKKVAFAKGSSANYLIVRILESEGLKWEDITPVYLSPADARAAFEQDNVDAWVIWDPFYALVQSKTPVRVIRDSKGLVTNRDFYLAPKSFADKNAKIIDAIRAETEEVATWAKANPEQVADFLSPLLKIDKPVLLTVTNRRTYGFETISPQVIAEQQAIADSFYKLKLIPKEIKVSEVIWQAPSK
ncbi:MAG: aliphatic sulfonate ABC transporter substrate-binding protein [Pseudanabaena frigida]|uniref:Putative aliphatic sulfonates-binding protein n=1 Tax=Pseudanabaena frigida TaxID=945775 RepID=A0A2W4W7X1_9CYAN|nr:MAG: aliphatic sulfonate ABC transporter substrate-binding protein [Pseudanabaena frigida]